MREILFRAKRIDNNEWVKGDLRQDRDLETAYISGWDYCITDGGLEREPFEYEIDSKTLCQFTGMIDKNGKRIWENDIVKYMWFGNEEVDIVEYRSTSIGLKENCNAVLTDITEVIGNVFDDKHLLDKTDYRREQEKETED